jgi:hypothetical protein
LRRVVKLAARRLPSGAHMLETFATFANVDASMLLLPALLFTVAPLCIIAARLIVTR